MPLPPKQALYSNLILKEELNRVFIFLLSRPTSYLIRGVHLGHFHFLFQIKAKSHIGFALLIFLGGVTPHPFWEALI